MKKKMFLVIILGITIVIAVYMGMNLKGNNKRNTLKVNNTNIETNKKVEINQNNHLVGADNTNILKQQAVISKSVPNQTKTTNKMVSLDKIEQDKNAQVQKNKLDNVTMKSQQLQSNNEVIHQEDNESKKINNNEINNKLLLVRSSIINSACKFSSNIPANIIKSYIDSNLTNKNLYFMLTYNGDANKNLSNFDNVICTASFTNVNNYPYSYYLNLKSINKSYKNIAVTINFIK